MVNKDRVIAYQLLTGFIALLVAILVYSMGRFGFLDILGIKRPIEVALLIPLVGMGAFSIVNSGRAWKSPLFLLPLIFLAGEILLRGNLLAIADLLVATLLTGSIISLREDFAEKVLRCIIIISGIFALLGILQFFILYSDPSLITHVLLFYDGYSGSDTVMIQHPLSLLGLATGEEYTLFGQHVTRLRSFTSEPSLIVAYFTLPGALAFTYRGRIRLCGWIILVFSLISMAGTVFMSVVFSIIVFIAFRVKSRLLHKFLPFFLMGFLILWLEVFNLDFILHIIRYLAGIANFLDKIRSATVRFGFIMDTFHAVIEDPLGVRQDITGAAGLILRSMAQSGFPGLIIMSALLISLFDKISRLYCFGGLDRGQKIGLIMLYGVFTTASIFSDYGFVCAYGFTIITLAYYRLLKMESAEFSGDDQTLRVPESLYTEGLT